MKTLTVAKATMNLNSCLKVVHEERESYELVKGGVPYARIVPVREESCTSHKLAEDLAKTKIALEDRREISAAVRKGRMHLNPLKSPWG